MRAHYESQILQMTEMVKYSQWQEAIKNVAALRGSFANAAYRYLYYREMLGDAEQNLIQQLPVLDDIDKLALAEFRFSIDEPQMAFQESDILKVLGINVMSGILSSGLPINGWELGEMMPGATSEGFQTIPRVLDTTSG